MLDFIIVHNVYIPLSLGGLIIPLNILPCVFIAEKDTFHHSDFRLTHFDFYC